MVNDNGEKEGEGDPDRGGAESPSDVQPENHPIHYIKKDAYNREFLNGEVERKKVQVALNGKGKRDNHPAAVTDYEEDDDEKADTQKAEQRSGIATEGLAGHPRGGDEEAERDKGEAHLLGCEVLHES